MALPAYMRVCFIGTLPGGEVFNTSFCAVPNGMPTNTSDLQDVIDAIYGAIGVGSFATALRNLLNPASSYQKIAGYFYAAGQTSASDYVETAFAAAGTGTEYHPNQCALVATLLTPFPGRRARGRMYWPCNGLTLATNAQANNSDCVGLAGAVAEAMGAMPGTWAAEVLSRVAGSASTVTSVRVDSRLDIQRRRANKQAAASVATATV